MIKKAVTILAFVAISAISIAIYHLCFEQKHAFIDIPKVFNGFDMKNEMQKKLKQTETLRMKIIDSLSLELQVISNRLKAEPKNNELMAAFDAKRQFYFKTQERIEQDNAALTDQYDKQILEQMSTYIMEYGKKNGYDFIYGSSGNGALMFANEQYNISDDIILFINSKYKGLE